MSGGWPVLLSDFTRWGWIRLLLAGWALGLGGAFVMSVALGLAAHMGLRNFSPGMYVYFVVVACALGLIGLGSFSLVRTWVGVTPAVIATALLTALLGYALVYLAQFVCAFTFLFVGPPI